jgi:Chromo (CHRromatin Organisation MOdifier) domain
VSLLTPYKETDAHGRNFPELPPDLIEGEPEYEVDQILAVRRHGRNQNLQYLLRWKGYSQAHDSWKPAENVTTPELIKDFYECNPDAEGGGRIKRRKKRQKICTITSTPTPLTTMSNALQISLAYPYSKEEYSSILEAMFAMEALAIGGQWSTSGASSAEDFPESIDIITTTATILTEEGETPDSGSPQSLSPVKPGELPTTPGTQSMSISPTLQPDCDPFRTKWGRPAPGNNHSSLSSRVFDLGPSDGYWASPPPSDTTVLISCRKLIAQMGTAYVHSRSHLQHVGGCLLVI